MDFLLPMMVLTLVAAVIWNGGKVLLGKRGNQSSLANTLGAHPKIAAFAALFAIALLFTAGLVAVGSLLMQPQ